MTFRLSEHQTLDIVSNEPNCLVVDTVYQPGGARPPAHYHPRQREQFTVHLGTVRAEVDGQIHDLQAGDTLAIEAGQVHRMWNPGNQVSEVRWATSPALDTEDWFRGLDQLQTTATAAGRAQPDPLSFTALAVRHRDCYRLVLGGPKPLGDIVVQVLGRIGRVLGR